MKLILLFFVVMVDCLSAQSPNFTISSDVTLTATSAIVTLQAPGAIGAVTKKTLYLKGVSITCSVACDVTVERDGSPPTGTLLPIRVVNRLDSPSIALAYYAADTGVGVVLAIFTLTGGTTANISVVGKTLGSGENFTLRTSSITGRVQVNCQWEER